MLREQHAVTQPDQRVARRWFFDEEFDLIVWLDPDSGGYIGFQLCYDKRQDEHVFSWHRDRGYAHNRIDDGESSPRRNMTPILVPDGLFDLHRVFDVFVSQAAEIDPDVRAFVVNVLELYDGAAPAGDV